MLQSVVIIIKRHSRVVRRINKNTLHLPRVILLQRFQREEIVPEDQFVIKEVVFPDAMRGKAGLLRVFDQDSRFEPQIS